MDVRSHGGFTLYELLVTLLVASVLFSIGVPSLRDFVLNNRMAAAANDMITAMLLARNEAITQRRTVTLCASPNPDADSPDCDSDLSGPDTTGGYVVWVDNDGDAVVDGGEDILRQQSSPEGIVLLGDSGFMTFAANGYLEDPMTSASAMLFCDIRGNTVAPGSLSAARAILIDPLGRGRVLNQVAEIQTLDVAEFGNLTCP